MEVEGPQTSATFVAAMERCVSTMVDSIYKFGKACALLTFVRQTFDEASLKRQKEVHTGQGNFNGTILIQ